MLNDLLKATGLQETDIISQISDEYERGYRFVVNKRDLFEVDLRLFKNQKRAAVKQKEKIGDSTLFNVHSALMARSYVSRPESKFVSTKIGKEYVVNNLNATLEEDFNAADMEILKYQRDWDKFFYGVGIVVRNGWDGILKQPKFEVVDPRNWIPDPDGDYVNNQYSYTGYDRNVFKTDLEQMGVPQDIIEQLRPNSGNFRGADRSRQDDEINSNLNPSFKKSNAPNPNYKIYYHFGIFSGPKGTFKALVVTGNEQKTILTNMVHLFEPVSKEEKKDQSLISFPFAFTYWKPRTNDPFGDRVATYVSDVQRVKAELANLRLDKSKAELYPMYLYNTRLIKNKEDLNFGFNKLVAANPLEGESINNAMTPIQRDFRADNSLVIDQTLDQQVESSTSIGKVAQGSLPGRRETAQTNNLVQDNTDINLALAEKVESWGEKQLLQLWLRGYLEKFTDGDVKVVNINNGYGITPRELRKDEFLSEQRVRIQIITVSELEQQRNEERLAYAATLPLLQTLPRGKAAQNYSFRRYLLSSGIPAEQVEIEIQETPQEIIAKQNTELLIAGEFVDVEQGYDVLTHLIAIKAAGNDLNVQLYRQSLLELYTVQGGDANELSQVEESVTNNVAAQGMSQLANESTAALAQ